MKISNKLLVGYAMLGATLLGSTGASFYTVNNLKNDIEFITERAWEAADGPMNGIIALEADFIKIQKSYIEPAEALSLVNSEPVELNEAKESFERLVGAEFLTEEEDKKLHSLINKYESARLDVVNKIKANPFATPHINDFTNIAHELIEFVGVLEEEGDARIEEAIEHSHVSVSEFNYISIITLIAAIIISLISYAFTRRSIVVPINDLREKLKDITQGSSNLNVKIDVKSEDELGDLATYFNTFIEQLKGTISQSLKLSLETDDKASALSAAVEQTTGNITTIRSETETVASSINEMSTSIKEVAVNASDASDAAREAKNNVESGQKIIESTIDRLENIALEVGRTSDSISNLKAGSEQISSVIDVIKNIAEQTNLLALNAAIEAARAGEQGRGFAVVADEVRSLAIRTRTSTEEIESMILQLVEQTDQAVTNMAEGQKTVQVAVEESDGARESLRLIIDSVEAIADMSMHIASASEQQGAVSNDIAENVNRINDSTIESDEAMIHTRDVTIELARIASDLRDQLSRFI